MRPRAAMASQSTSDQHIWVDYTVAVAEPEAIGSWVDLFILNPPCTEETWTGYASNITEYSTIMYGDVVQCVFPLASIAGTSFPSLYRFAPDEEDLDQLLRYVSIIRSWERERQFEASESSTAPREHPETIDEGLEALFAEAKEQIFEDGMESDFSRELVSLIKKYGDAAMEVVAYLIVYEKVNPEVAAEALRWLGSVDHPPTYRYRLWLAERSLRCSSPRVRDGAILALAYLDDTHAVSHVKQAIERENIEELREDMSQVLASLNRSH